MIGGRASQRVAIGVVVLLAAGLGVAWYTGALESRTHIPADVVYEYRSAFTPGQIAPGWTLLSVGPNVEDPTKIVHRVQVPAALAGELVMMSAGARNRRVGAIACPAADDPIWGKLTRSQDVVIELHTEKGPFETISCRSAVH